MKDDHSKPEAIDGAAQAARREFLRKAGKLAVYTPPVIMALMHPGANAIGSGGKQADLRDDLKDNQDEIKGTPPGKPIKIWPR